MTGAEETGEAPARNRARSFVRREGRLTRGQARALRELWPRYGLDGAGPWDLDTIFGRQAPRILEVGFGDGEALAEQAATAPGYDFIGTEVHRPGLGRCLLTLEERALGNVRIAALDALDALRRCIPAGSLTAVHVFFPDPWPKKRHHKRRLVQQPFLDAVACALKPGGTLHLATDWDNYAEWILEVVGAHPDFENQAPGGGALPSRPPRPETKFERRGRARGHTVHDFLYRRLPSSES